MKINLTGIYLICCIERVIINQDTGGISLITVSQTAVAAKHFNQGILLINRLIYSFAV